MVFYGYEPRHKAEEKVIACKQSAKASKHCCSAVWEITEGGTKG